MSLQRRARRPNACSFGEHVRRTGWVGRVGRFAVIAAWFGLAVGCTSIVVPPREPAAPVQIFFLSEALHVGVVLPRDAKTAGDYVEYGFGDWRWYALGRDRWYHVFRTVLWPTQGALCRREFAAANAEELRAVASWAELSPLLVGGAEVTALRERLDAQFRAREGEAVARRELGFRFVPCDESYWFAWTCADAVAVWLRELGCSVGWAPIRGNLRVRARPCQRRWKTPRPRFGFT